MAAHLHEEGPEQSLAVDDAVLPAIAPPAARAEPDGAQQPSRGRCLRKFRLQNVGEHPLLECRIPVEGGDHPRVHSQAIDRYGIQTVQETVHVHAPGQDVQCFPVDPVVAVFDEHRPVGDVPHADLRGGKVRGGMPQQEEGVEVGRGQLHGGAVDLDLFGRLLAGAALQLLFDGAVGEVGVDVQEVEMVFDQNAVEGEGRVMVDILVDLHLSLAAQQLVGLLLAAVEPDVDVAARPVFGPRVGEAQSVPLEKHHRNAVPVHEGCQAADDAPLPDT